MSRISSRTTTAAAAAVAVTALTGGALALSGAASAHDQARADKPAVLRYSLGQGQFAMDDLGEPSPHGPGVGDIVVQTQPVRAHGKTIGRIHNVAVGVDGKRNLFQADGTLSLPGGTIEYAGLVEQTPHFVLALTGGTGKYAGASGKIAFDFPGQQQWITVTFGR